MSGLHVVFKALALPPLNLFILMAMGWLIRRRWPRLGHALVLTAILFLYALCTPYVGSQLALSLQSDPPLPVTASAQGAGAIVILSGDVYANAPEYQGDTIGDLTLARLRYGVRLARQLNLPILVSGGQPKYANQSLAEAMQEALKHDFQIPARWLESRSLNTHENAQYSAAILKENRIDKIYLVTHAVHMSRAKSAFTSFNIDVIPAPTRFAKQPTPILGDFIPAARALSLSHYAIYEWIGRLWYAIAYR